MQLLELSLALSLSHCAFVTYIYVANAYNPDLLRHVIILDIITFSYTHFTSVFAQRERKLHTHHHV